MQHDAAAMIPSDAEIQFCQTQFLIRSDPFKISWLRFHLLHSGYCCLGDPPNMQSDSPCQR